MLKATVEGQELVIRVPLNATPIPSASGKTLVVASSHGNQKTGALRSARCDALRLGSASVRPSTFSSTSGEQTSYGRPSRASISRRYRDVLASTIVVARSTVAPRSLCAQPPQFT